MKPWRIAITGGIGSGKSFVCRKIHEQTGMKVFDCDASAKQLMRTSKSLQQALERAVDSNLYVGGVLQKQVLAQFLLASEENKQIVNNIVHPAVAADFERSGCQWLESAIFFDSGFNRRVHFDKVVCVTAPLEIRVSRVMKRDAISYEKALEWTECQLPQEEVRRRSDYEIVNDGVRDVDTQIRELLATIATQQAEKFNL